MFVIGLLLGIGAAILLLLALILLLQVVMGLLPSRAGLPLPRSRPRIAVLVPAHNESAGIATTINKLRLQLLANDRLLVVADNCMDETAALARAAGAEVIERTDAVQRGKGYALDYGVRHLESEPPEILIIVDADCELAPGSLARLAGLAAVSGRPAQALNLMTALPGSGLKLRLAEFAWRVKNWARPLGAMRMGWPCQLTGTGMAFPWTVAKKMSLANASIAEDMKLGIELTLAGTPPLFCPEARVNSEFPAAGAAISGQRTRWEHGHLGMILHEAPRLLWRALLRLDMQALWLALDLLIPPLALLVLLQVGMLVLAGLATLLGAGFMPLALAALGLAVLYAAVLLAWLKWGRQVVRLSELFLVPLYVLTKIPLYFRFWTRRQQEWVRTERK